MNTSTLQAIRTRLGFARGSDKASDELSAYAELDTQGRILKASPAYEQLMGYPPGRLTGHHHRELHGPGDAQSEAFARFLGDITAGRLVKSIVQRIRANGDPIWLQVSYQLVLDRHGKVTRIVEQAADVSEQQIAALDMEARLEALDRTQGVIEFALDGTILTANDRFLEMVGYSLDEIVGKHHSLLVDPLEARSPAYHAFWDRLRAGRHASSLFRRIGHGGREIWIQASYNPVLAADGQTLKVIKYATDVTSQTQAARALQQEVVQLAETVQGNAQLASQATDISQQAQQRLQEGRQVIDRLIADMEAIHASMKSITGITDLIDSITLRTRLLSLNARVEAAHAGEAGRGFAVVATEINGLATQCKNATNEIHDLLEQAAHCVQQGEMHTAEADQAMLRMATAIRDISQSTQSIQQAAARQEGGIKRVNAAVSELQQANHLPGDP
ncbi:methyl-accepting chemotaxis protein [Frateuria aurantia]|uniref:PAS domain S-box n=1 Tax=Frateuria aurantia (strain ATCC 33424 / DSM 6220 / KCTC 2777 / LMG 1558 / NBRC 3245 / NCIMB 13370) TaxID=767434 RepID=H8L6U1_FRAAD|nr:PAS domain-containing methyl-accepting chemotaxis protein [Frateuria aurantia]AFC86027.1 PAS domain S-box [Frateuria aurantia DSM 6220]